MYHKYDTIAYPKNTSISKPFLKTVAYSILGWLTKSKEKQDQPEISENFVPMNQKEMNAFCLEQYLIEIKKMLCSGTFLDGYNIHTIGTEITSIYNSLCVDCISFTGESLCPVHPINKGNKKNLREVSAC